MARLARASRSGAWARLGLGVDMAASRLSTDWLNDFHGGAGANSHLSLPRAQCSVGRVNRSLDLATVAVWAVFGLVAGACKNGEGARDAPRTFPPADAAPPSVDVTGDGREAGAPPEDAASQAPGAGQDEGPPDASSEAGVAPPQFEPDVFGVRKLFPTVHGGLEWDSRHWEVGAYDAPFGTPDPNDPLRLSNQRGDGMVHVEGDGTLRMTGSQPRLYIGTAQSHPWRNVEITAYYQRREDDDTDWAGLVIGARSGANGHGTDNCTATTYYARFRNDGNADIEKELEHPAALPRETTPLWDGADPPYGTWIGMKFVVVNVDGDRHVRLRVFRDLTEGRDGGTWEPVIDYVDRGGWAPDHHCDYAPDFIITQGGGVVLIRNTGVIGQGALYKWVSVREIAPEP